MNYLIGVIYRILLLILLCISIPLGFCIIVIGFIIGFIFGFEITDEMSCYIMMWPIPLLDKIFKNETYRIN